MKTFIKAQKNKPGRPKSAPKPAARRYNTRFPASLAERVEMAAAVRGVAVSAFILESVAERAERIIDAEHRWVLTRAEAETISKMIENPPKPTKAMIEATRLAAGHVVIRS